MASKRDAGPVTSTDTSPEVWPDLTARDAKVYLDAQIPYENFASNKMLAARALTLYQQAVTKFDTQTRDIKNNWQWLDWLFRANSLRRTGNKDVHVPELLKSHRALIPRIVEAFFGNGQNFFATRGVDSQDRERQNAVTGLLQYQLEQNNFRMLMSPFASSVCKYQVGIFKCSWEVKTGKRAYHWFDRTVKDGKIHEVSKRQVRDVATWNGNKIRLVDPHRFIVDAQRWAIGDLAYVGDRSDWAMHDILSYQGFQNLDLVQELIQNGNAVEAKVTPQQVARSGLRPAVGAADRDSEPRNTSQFAEVGELWCWFNWAPDGKPPDMRETIITVVAGSIVVRVQENFHDDKHVPYAIARYSDNGIEFFDVGLYDPAMRVQDEIDHTRGTAYEAADLILAPRAFTKGPAIDLPNNLFDMPAGWIGKDVGDIVFQPVPNTLQVLPMIDQIQRRDVEEITGVTRLWQGTEGAMVGSDQTATEVRRKIEESNRRLLGLIRSIDEGMTALLRIMHANNQQFMSQKQRFRILDPKWAKELGRNEYEISPSELMGPVDFVFHGVTRIQQWGLRGTNLLTWLQVMGPMIQENPDKFNMAGIARQSYQAIVGEESEDEVLVDQSNLNTMVSQKDENNRLLMGQRTPVHPMDDDDGHLRDMEADGLMRFIANKSIDPALRRPAYEHMQAHVEQARRKQAQMQALRRQAEVRALMMGTGGAGEGEQAPPPGGLERGRGQTNGDGTNQQVPRAGRKTAISEANNG